MCPVLQFLLLKIIAAIRKFHPQIDNSLRRHIREVESLHVTLAKVDVTPNGLKEWALAAVKGHSLARIRERLDTAAARFRGPLTLRLKGIDSFPNGRTLYADLAVNARALKGAFR